MAYFKTNVLDNQIKALPTIASASGSVANFTTDKAENLVDCEVAIVATGGGGTPTTPIAINGFSACNLVACGINLCDEVFETGDISFATGGNITGASWIRTTNYVPIVGGLTIYVKSELNINMFFYDSNKVYLGNNSEGLRPNIKNTVITISNNARYFRIATNQTPYNHDISINYPSTDTQYHAYNGTTETISFGQTIYGGVLNVGTGVLRVTHKCVQLTQAYVLSGSYLGSIIYNVTRPETSDADFTKAYICNRLQYVGETLANFTYGTCIAYSNSSFNLWIKNGAFADLAEATQWLVDNPTYICYELATPQTIQLSAQEIATIANSENNIWADTGDIEVKFVLSVGSYVNQNV